MQRTQALRILLELLNSLTNELTIKVVQLPNTTLVELLR
jgi:hypothetical protein